MNTVIMVARRGPDQALPPRALLQRLDSRLRLLRGGARDRPTGSVAVMEMIVPAGDKLTAPPHSHDAYEETI